MKIVSLNDWSLDLLLTSHCFPTISLPPRGIPVSASHGGRPGCKSHRTPAGLCRGNVRSTPSLPFLQVLSARHMEGRVLKGVDEKYFALSKEI